MAGSLARRTVTRSAWTEVVAARLIQARGPGCEHGGYSLLAEVGTPGWAAVRRRRPRARAIAPTAWLPRSGRWTAWLPRSGAVVDQAREGAW